METILKNLCGAAVLALCSITAASAATESYPNKTITLIVPFAPGGPADIMGRTIAKNLADDLGQAIVVVNKAGAGGNIGTDALAKSNPDGYTLGISLISSLAIAPSLYSKLPYDVKRDIAPISMVGIATPAILAHPSAPFNTFDEMIRYAKAHPGTLNYSTPGVGRHRILPLNISVLSQASTSCMCRTRVRRRHLRTYWPASFPWALKAPWSRHRSSSTAAS